MNLYKINYLEGLYETAKNLGFVFAENDAKLYEFLKEQKVFHNVSSYNDGEIWWSENESFDERMIRLRGTANDKKYIEACDVYEDYDVDLFYWEIVSADISSDDFVILEKHLQTEMFTNKRKGFIYN